MTNEEIVAAINRLASQQNLDRMWMTTVEQAITDHAEHIDKCIGMTQIGENGLHQLKLDLQMLAASADGNDTSIKKVINDNDAAMKKIIEHRVTALDEMLKDLKEEDVKDVFLGRGTVSMHVPGLLFG